MRSRRSMRSRGEAAYAPHRRAWQHGGTRRRAHGHARARRCAAAAAASISCWSAATSPMRWRAARARRARPAVARAVRDATTRRRAGCANTRARATSCCSRVRASTEWRRSSRGLRVSSPSGLLVTTPRCRRGSIAIPVRTRLIRQGDDLVALLREALAGIARPGDVVAIAETAVAIAQGELHAGRERSPVKLGVRARAARRCAGDDQPARIDAARDRSGRRLARVRRRRCLQVAGRAVRQARRLLRNAGRGDRGDRRIYRNDAAVRARDRALLRANRIAFAPNALRDRSASTSRSSMPTICAAPKCWARRRASNREAVERALLGNPHGNGDEQTPLVVLDVARHRSEPAPGAAPHDRRFCADGLLVARSVS